MVQGHKAQAPGAEKLRIAGKAGDALPLLRLMQEEAAAGYAVFVGEQVNQHMTRRNGIDSGAAGGDKQLAAVDGNRRTHKLFTSLW